MDLKKLQREAKKALSTKQRYPRKLLKKWITQAREDVLHYAIGFKGDNEMVIRYTQKEITAPRSEGNE